MCSRTDLGGEHAAQWVDSQDNTCLCTAHAASRLRSALAVTL